MRSEWKAADIRCVEGGRLAHPSSVRFEVWLRMSIIKAFLPTIMKFQNILYVPIEMLCKIDCSEVDIIQQNKSF